MPELITTPEGLRILVEELPHTYSVSIGCFLAAGARGGQHRIGGEPGQGAHGRDPHHGGDRHREPAALEQLGRVGGEEGQVDSSRSRDT